MAPYKRKSDRKIFTREMMVEAKRRLEAGESKRKVANDLGINECTLRKRIKAVSTFFFNYSDSAYM